MCSRMSFRIEDAQKNKTRCTDSSTQDGDTGENFLAEAYVGDETAVVTEPAFGDEGEKEEEAGYDATDDEQGL